MTITIEDTKEAEKPLLDKYGKRITLHRIYLHHKGKRVISLYHYMKKNFNIIIEEYNRLVKIAKERYGKEGWRRVSFEGLGLLYANNEGLEIK